MKNLAAHLTHILGRLRQAVAAFAARQDRGPSSVLVGTRVFIEAEAPSPHRLIPTATWHLLTDRLARLAQRFRALLARAEAGTLSPPRPRPATPRPPRPAHPRLPGARGWINARVAAAAPCAGELQMLIQAPATAELLADIPQAGRLLRPLCRALAVDLPDWLRLPPRERKPRPKPRVRHPEQREGSTLPSPPRPLPAWHLEPPRTRKNSA